RQRERGRGRWRRHRRRRLDRLLEGGGRGRARLLTHAVEDALVGGERPGVRRRRPLTARGHAAFEEDERLAAGHVADALEEGASIADAFDVRECNRRRVVVREELEEVRHGYGGGGPPPGPPAHHPPRPPRRGFERPPQ